MTGSPKELWSDNRVPYQLYDFIYEPYRFINGKVKLPTCNADIDRFCNGGELHGMVRVGCMTYFQYHKWHDELANGKLKDETLIHKAKFKESWGDATPRVMKFYAWLKSSFKNFHELDYDGPYVNVKTKKNYDPYLDINRLSGRTYKANNVSDTQDCQEHKEKQEEHRDNPTGNGYHQQDKSKQNRTKPSAKWNAWKSQKSTKVNPVKVKIKDGAEAEELLNGPTRTHLMGWVSPFPQL
nr:hypothetical protein [Tanacetum cinerariifolium]